MSISRYIVVDGLRSKMSFPDSGPYVVPGALAPVVIDREADEGRYEDPNVWMRHTIK